MQRTLLWKLLVVGAISVALLVPLAMIQSVVAERASRRQEAVASVQASFAGAQTIVVPFIVWPYREEWEETVAELDNREKRKVQRREERQLTVFADLAELDASTKVSLDRYRGLHQVRTYAADINLALAFTLPDRRQVEPQRRDGRLIWEQPYLVLGLTDLRGLRGGTRIDVEGTQLELTQGTRSAIAGNGIHAILPPAATAGLLKVAAKLDVVGIENLSFVPTATRNDVRLRSDWPHPGFGGRFLPGDRAIGPDGFNARWSVAALTTPVRQQILDRPPSGAVLATQAFGVDLVEPVNIYLLAERATKYGALFIVLVVATVFAFETLRRLPVHPIQYGLTGLALALFFLLLLSLSEHLSFGLSYLLAAAGCVTLIAVYLGYALRSTRAIAVIGLGLALVYAALYGILIAETLALLMGSLLLFAALAAIMLATRQVDWYSVTPSGRPASPA